MLTQKETLNNLLQQWNDYPDFSPTGMKSTLVRTMLAAARHPEQTCLTSEDFDHVAYFTEFLEKVEAYQAAQPNKGRILAEMYKAGITLADVDRVMLYVDSRLQRRKDYKGTDVEKLFLKIWAFLSERV